MLARRLAIPYFDSDDYFWEQSDVPFSVQRAPELRNEKLKADMAKYNSWIIGGSMIRWGIDWHNVFDMVVFLRIPKAARMQRIKKRELERYGDKIYTDTQRAALHLEFLTWAAGYDDNTAKGPTLLAHTTWLQQLSCPVLEINGDIGINKSTNMILKAINGA